MRASVPGIAFVPALAITSQDIDRYGELCRQIDLVAPQEAEAKVLAERFQAAAASEPADQVLVRRGLAYEIQFGARKNERTVTDVARAFQLLRRNLGGLAGALGVINIPLTGAVDKHLTESQRSEVVTSERSGSRSLTTVALRAPASAAKEAA